MKKAEKGIGRVKTKSMDGYALLEIQLFRLHLTLWVEDK